MIFGENPNMKFLLFFDIIMENLVKQEGLTMYLPGEMVMYGFHGVCRVRDVQERLVDRVRRQYLVLEPTCQGGQFLVPMHNAAAMGKVSQLLSRQELTELLASRMVHTFTWVPDENRRKQRYRELTAACTRENLAQTLYSLYVHRERQGQVGKKLHICDDNLLHDAEKILSSEIEAVLGYPGKEALEFLRAQLRPETE